MKSVRLALQVIEAVADQGPVGVSELARHFDVPKSTAQRSLAVLADLGWIRPAQDSATTQWVLTTKALTVGGTVADRHGLRAAALPVMRELSQRTRETIHLTVPEGREIVLVEKVDSTLPVRTVSWVGGRVPIYAASAGKAMLAHMAPDEVEQLLAGELSAMTDRTVTDLEVLQAELAEVRRRGWALNVGQWRDDVAAIGAAVLDGDGRPVAAVSISTPASRLPEERWDEYGQLVVDATRRVSAELNGS